MARKRSDFEALQQRLDYIFLDTDLLEEALTHASAGEGRPVKDNGRLAFLGDAVIELAVREARFRGHPQEPRGKLSEDVDRVVPDVRLARRAAAYQLADWLDVGAGEAKNPDGETRRLADAFEALAGAIYLDCGLHAFAVLRRLLLED